MYKGKPLLDLEGQTLIERQALHAALLGFNHPISEEPMVFVAPLRDEVRACIDFLRARGNPTPVFVEGTVPMERLALD